jgi:ubiquinone/menaquinone biosynthesis C-methylase UbiE
MDDEAARIRREFERRDRIARDERDPVARFFDERKVAMAGLLLRQAGLLPGLRTALDVGCGRGMWLRQLEAWGVPRAGLAGIDLSAERIDAALLALADQGVGGADLRVGDASRLPWPARSFELVIQSTVFTSILDPSMRRAVAAEMLRVVTDAGAILWYDFRVNNPRNPHVRGIGPREIRELFPGCRIELRRATLAPPLARLVVPLSAALARALEAAKVLNTHDMALIRKEAPVEAPRLP